MKFNKLLPLLLFSLLCAFSFAQHTHQGFHTEDLKIDVDELQQNIQKAISKSSLGKAEISLPFIHGSQLDLNIQETDIVDKVMRKKYPNIKTYRVWSFSDGVYRGNITMDQNDLFVFMKTPQGIYNVRPSEVNSKGKHTIELGIKTGHDHVCLQNPTEALGEEFKSDPNINSEEKLLDVINSGDQLRKYRFAVAVTQSFYNTNGGNDSEVTKYLVAITNALNVFYENDFACRFVLVDPVYGNLPTTATFDNAGNKPDQAMSEVNKKYNSSSYDIGHAFDTGGGGGVAYLNALCGSLKGGGYSGAYRGINSSWLQLAGHELGHMFGSPHSFSGDGGSCSSNIGIQTSYEMASGITIMSYNGICGGGQNIPNNGDEDAYFHAMSLDRGFAQINRFPGCGSPEDSGNTPPEAFADTCGTNLSIPKNTPFILRGHAFDPDDDALTYSWEQYDLSSAALQGDIGNDAANNSSGPLFRGYPPVGTPDRYIPPLSRVLSGGSDNFEPLPNVSRDINFRLVVRDNNPGVGGVSIDEMGLRVHNSGPFSVESPKGGDNLVPGQPFTFEWNRNGSEAICDNLEIRLSYDLGLNFDVVLATGLDFDAGSATVDIPLNLLSSGAAYIMLACADNTCVQFFNISNGTVSIESVCQAQSAVICPSDSLITDEATPVLSMDLQAFRGAPIQSIRADNSSDGLIKYTVWNLDKTACTQLKNRSQQQNRIVVSETGEYVFRINSTSFDFSGSLSIFDAATFDENDLCTSFISSSASVSNIDEDQAIQTSFLRARLESCRTYILVGYSGNVGNSSSFPSITAIGGAGDVFQFNEEASEDRYTYYAVDNATGMIVMVDDEGDFFDLIPGKYTIHGVSYKDSGPTPPSNLDPSFWVGQMPSDIFREEDCQKPSRNSRYVEIKTTCRILDIEEVSRTACEVGISTFDLTLSVTHKLSPDQGDLVVNGFSFPVEASPQTVVLTDQFANGQEIPIQAFFTEVPSCRFLTELFITAPENCCGIALNLGEDKQVCIGEEEIILNAGDDGVSYEWTRDGENLNIALGQNNLDVLDVPGLYRVLVKNEFDCPAEDSIRIEVTPLPEIFVSEDETICDDEFFIISSFTNANGIDWFKGNQALPQFKDFTELIVEESGQFIAQAESGFNCISRDTFNLTVNPIPVVALGEDIIRCDKQTVDLDAGPDGATYEWRLDEVLFSEERMVTISEGDVYIVDVINEFGCRTSDTLFATFHPLPTLDLGEDSALCEGFEKQIVADSETNNDYTWFKDGVRFDNPDRDFFNTSIPGTFVVEVENEFSCAVSDTIEVVFNVNPTVDLGERQVAACSDELVILDAGDEGSIYEWTRDFVPIEDETGSTLEITRTGSYGVRVTNEFGCDNTDLVQINILAIPEVEILGEDQVMLCDGQRMSFSTRTPVRSELRLDGELIPEYTGFVFNVFRPGMYVLNGFNQLGCVGSDTLIVVYEERPEIDFGEDILACVGDEFTLNAGDPNIEYQWFVDGGPVDDFNNPIFEVSNSGVYRVVATNEFGCEGEDQILIDLAAPPMVRLDEDDRDICEGDEVTLRVQFFEALSAQWLKDGDFFSDAGGITDNIRVSESGTYTFEASGQYNCITRDSVTISVQPNPEIELGEAMTGCVGEEAIVLNGGNENNTYRWRRGNTTLPETGNLLEITESGNYSVTVTNEFGCFNTDQIMVTITTPPDADITSDFELICAGEEALIETNASVLEMISWFKDGVELPEENWFELNIDGPGEYLLVVMDFEGCESRDSIIIEESDIPIVDLGIDRSECADVAITLDAGLDGINYSWTRNNNALPVSTSTIEATESGTYTVVVTNANGCSESDVVEVEIAELASVDIVEESVTFCIGENFEIESNLTGDSFEWRLDGALINTTDINLTALQAGTYSLVVSNSLGCTVEDQIEIVVSDLPTVELGANLESCAGETVLLEAGNPGLNYQWIKDNRLLMGETSSTLEVTESGNYSVVVSNDNDCASDDAVEVTFFDLPLVNIEESEAAICTGDNFTIISNLQGSSFEWSLDGQIINTSSPNLTALIPGVYTLIVQNEIECTVMDEIVITESIIPEINLGEDEDICGNDFKTLEAGSTGLIYQWTLNGEVINNNTNILVADESGAYAVTVSNNEGCMDTDDILLRYFPEPFVNIEEREVIICAGDTYFIASNFEGDSFQWFRDGVEINSPSSDLEVDEPGTYMIVASNEIDCQFTDEVIITQSSTTVTVDLGEGGDFCDGDEINLVAGDPNLAYEWRRDGILISNNTNTLEVELSGVYTVIATSEDGCIANDQVTINIFPSPTAEIGAAEITECQGTELILTPEFSGGDFEWRRDGVLIVNPTSELSITESGTYEFIVSNEGDCSATDLVEITIIEVPQIDLGDNESFCAGESQILNVDITAGEINWFRDGDLIASNVNEIEATESGVYSAVLSIDGLCSAEDEVVLQFLPAPTVIINDELVGACLGDEATVTGLTPSPDFVWLFNGAPLDIDELSFSTDNAGLYILEASNEAGCTSRDTVEVLINDIPEVNLDETELACLGSIIELDAGDAGETYRWERNGVRLIERGSTLSVDESGTYEVTVIDQFGCENSDQSIVSIVPGPTLEVSPNQSLCIGDNFTIEAETNGENIFWTKDGEMIFGETDFTLNVDETATYAAVVVADSGCEIIDTVRVTFNGLPKIEIENVQTLCEGTELTLDISETPGESIAWFLGTEDLNVTTPMLTVTEAGSYSVVVTNEASCSETANIEVIADAAPMVSFEDEYNLCEGATTTIDLASNGVGFQWARDGVLIEDQLTDSFETEEAGSYTVIVTGTNTCTTEAAFEVIERELPFVSLGIDETLCPDESTQLDAGIHDSYLWSTGETTQTINLDSPNPAELEVDVISVQVTSEFNCQASDEVEITYSGEITAIVDAEAAGVCEDESITLTASGGPIYEWLNNDGSLNSTSDPLVIASPEVPTEYMVVVSDECPGNADTVSVFVDVFSRETLSITQDTSIILGLDLELNVEAGPGARYEWEDNGTFLSSIRVANPIVMPNVPTRYSVTVTSVTGCVFEASVNVDVILDPLDVLKPISIISPNGDGKNDFLEFRGLEAFTDNRLTVFDRWGSIVFDKRSYQVDGNLWDGTKNNQDLPAGIYFYVLEFSTFKIKETLTIVRN